MSIVCCPECNKQISSRAALCNYCGFQLGEVTEQDLEIFRARKLRDRIYRLNMISYGAITVFIAGFAWYWWDSRGFSQLSSIGPFILMGLAAIAYLAVRVLLFRARQQRKAMRAKRQLSNELRKNL
jgi:hypothetical protein